MADVYPGQSYVAFTNMNLTVPSFVNYHLDNSVVILPPVPINYTATRATDFVVVHRHKEYTQVTAWQYTPSIPAIDTLISPYSFYTDLTYNNVNTSGIYGATLTIHIGAGVPQGVYQYHIDLLAQFKDNPTGNILTTLYGQNLPLFVIEAPAGQAPPKPPTPSKNPTCEGTQVTVMGYGTGGATSYKIYNAATNTLIATTSLTTYTITGLTLNQSVQIYVIAVNDNGESPPSDILQIIACPVDTYPPPPVPPRNQAFSCTPVSSSTMVCP